MSFILNPRAAAPPIHHTKPGKGNGGTVLKALYLPTMKLVALKSVPIYSAERRQQMVQVGSCLV